MKSQHVKRECKSSVVQLGGITDKEKIQNKCKELKIKKIKIKKHLLVVM